MEIRRENLPKIPNLIKTEEEGLHFLVTVKGRQPKCLGCGALGHTRSDCPQLSGVTRDAVKGSNSSYP